MIQINSNDINQSEWDHEIAVSNRMVFSTSAYLSALSTNWFVLKSDQSAEKTNAIAISTTQIGKIASVYVPVFSRQNDPIQNDEHFMNEVLSQLKSQFKLGEFRTSSEVKQHHPTRKVYQEIQDKLTPNTRAKRMFKKAESAGIQIRKTETSEKLEELIYTELNQKVQAINKQAMLRFGALIQAMQANKQLTIYGIFHNEKLVGGMYFIDHNNRRLYLKGACLPEFRDLGGMYACMKQAIEEALQQQFVFDFGGSSVEGVRAFNLNFGGKDVEYFVYNWDHSPTWFQFLRKLKKKLLR